MTQNNEREAFEKWSLENGYFTEYDDYGTSTICFDEDKWIAWKARAQSPISQNEQQEAVDLHERIRNLETQLQNWKDFCKKIQASLDKKIIDEETNP